MSLVFTTDELDVGEPVELKNWLKVGTAGIVSDGESLPPLAPVALLTCGAKRPAAGACGSAVIVTPLFTVIVPVALGTLKVTF